MTANRYVILAIVLFALMAARVAAVKTWYPNYDGRGVVSGDTITFPADGDVFLSGQQVSFTCTRASDDEDYWVAPSGIVKMPMDWLPLY